MIYVFLETPRFRDALEAYPNLAQCYARLRDRFHLKRAWAFTVPGLVSLGGGFFGRQLGSRAIVFRLKSVLSDAGQFLTVWAVDVVQREQLRQLDEKRYEKEIEAIPLDLGDLTKGVETMLAGQLKKLPDKLRRWWGGLLTPKPEWFVFESDQWAKAVRDFPERYDLLLQEALERIASQAGEDNSSVAPELLTDSVCNPNWKAFYGLAGGHVYLIDLVDGSKREQARRRREGAEKTWKRLVGVLRDARDPQLIVDELARRSVRAYPSLVLCDSELSGRAIKRRSSDEFAVDIALSSEEVGVLEQLCQAQKLPLFLQGRAGSGKSTVLYHYLVELLCHLDEKLAECGKVELVTYSPGLVKAAGDIVQSLLKTARRLNQGGTLTDDDWSIRTFYDLCLTQLPSHARRRFLSRSFGPDGGYIDAVRFRMLYSGTVDRSLERFRLRTKAATTLPWETAWHVIRSYIKGYKLPGSEMDFLDPEAYAELPRKDQSVPVEEYERVWREVWPWYVRLTCVPERDGGWPLFWDDLDLARAVVLNDQGGAEPKQAGANGGSRSRAIALLCDEAQDLSVVELVALLREFVWLDYDLTTLPGKPGDLPVPLILAGDLFQTVNPSGFNWSIASRIIVEALRQCFGHDRVATIHTCDLRFNYRNPREVGNLANTVQWARRHLFGHESKPQEIWKSHEGSGSVSWLDLDDREVLSVLETGPLPVIVPAPVDSDEFRTVFGDTVAEQLPKESAITPSEIKGLEVTKAAVFGFGKWFAAKELDRSLAKVQGEGKRHTFPVEYFFNSLYVAITRATEQLFIVDSQEAIHNGLWNHLRNTWKEAAPEQWKPYVGFDLVRGRPEELTSEPGEIARKLWWEAQQKEDPTLARRAAFYFDKAGTPRDRVVASAYADYWEGKVIEAARALEQETLEQEGLRPVALRWYFEAGAWDDILRLTRGDSGAAYAKLSAFAAELNRPAASLQDVDRKLELLEQVMNLELLRESARKHARAKVVTESLLQDSLGFAATCHDVGVLARVFRAYRHRYLDLYGLAEEHVATLAYRLALLESPEKREGLLREAVALWKRAQKTNHEAYYSASAMISPYPSSLEWWDRANRTDKVLDEFDEYGRHQSVRKLNSAQRRIVVEALERAGRWPEAFTIEFVAEGTPAAVLERHEEELRKIAQDENKLRKRLNQLLVQARQTVEQDPGIENPPRFYASRLVRLAEAIEGTRSSPDSLGTGTFGPSISDKDLRVRVLDFVLDELMGPEGEKCWVGWPGELKSLDESGRSLDPANEWRLAWVPRWNKMIKRLMHEESAKNERNVATAVRAWLASMELLFDLRRDEQREWWTRPRSYFHRDGILKTLAGLTPVATFAQGEERQGLPRRPDDQNDWFQEQVWGVVSVAKRFKESTLQNLISNDEATAETVGALFRYIEGLARALNGELVGWTYRFRENRYSSREREQIERDMWSWWESTFQLAMLAHYRKLAVEVAEAWYDFFRSPRIVPLLREARRRHAEGGRTVLISQENPTVLLGDLNIVYVHDRNLVLIQDLSRVPPTTATFSAQFRGFVEGGGIPVRSDGPNRWIVFYKGGELRASYDPGAARLRIDVPDGKVYEIRFDRVRR